MSESTRVRPGQARRRWPLRIGLALVVCGSLLWPSFKGLPLTTVQAAGDPVRFVPSTALLYAEANFQPTGAQAANWSHLITVITHEKGYKKAITALMGSSLTSTDMKQVQDAIQGLGNHTGVALFAAGTTKNPTVNGLVFVPPASGAVGSPMDLFNSFKSLMTSVRPTGLYYGHILYTVKVGDAALPGSIVDGTIILGASASAAEADHLLRVSLDAADGRRPSLATSATFARVRASLPSARLGYTFVNTSRFLDWATGLAAETGSSPVGSLKGLDLQRALGQVEPVGVALEALPRGLRIVTSGFATPAGMSRPKAITGDTATYASPDALAYMAVSGLGSGLLAGLRTADKAAHVQSGTSGDMLHQSLGLGAIEQQLKLNIERDVLPLLDGELGFSITLKPGFIAAQNDTAKLLNLVQTRLALRLTQAGPTGAVMAHINAWLQKQTGIHWARISATTRGMMEPSLGLGYKMNDQWLLAGTQISQHWSGGLSKSSGFVEALHNVAGQTSGGIQQPTAIVYLGLDAGRSLLEDLFSGAELATYHEQAKPLLMALHTLTLASRIGPDGAQSMAIFVGIH